MREATACLTNHPGLAEPLERWCESVSERNTEPDKHTQLKGGLAAPQYPAEFVEAISRISQT